MLNHNQACNIHENYTCERANSSLARIIITQVAFVPENKADNMESGLELGFILLCFWTVNGEENKSERISSYIVSTNGSNSIFFNTTYIENLAIFGVGASVLAALVAPLFGFSLTSFLGDGSSSNSEYAKYGFEKFTHDQQKQSTLFYRKSQNLIGMVNDSLEKGRDKFKEAVKRAEKNGH